MKRKKLFLAVFEGNTEKLEKLIRKGVNVNARSLIDKVTPLHAAARHNHADTARLLIEHGAHVNAREGAKETPLHWAAERGCAETARVLLENGAIVDARAGSFGETPLQKAAWNGHAETASLLIEHGADVRKSNWLGQTPLHLAAAGYWVSAGKGQLRVMKLLVEKGADVNARTDEFSDTPLHMAARHNRIEAAKFLLDKGADINAKNNDGWTPLFAARHEMSAKTADLLARRGGKAGRR